MKEGITQYQIKDIVNDVNDLKVDVKKILENHLPHLHEEIATLKTRINVMTAINLGAIIIGIILSKVL